MAAKVAKGRSFVYNEAKRIYPVLEKHVLRTPLEMSPILSESSAKLKVYLKLESEQVTGSIKIRGACNKVLKAVTDNPKAKEIGFTTASSGNHAKGCCMAFKSVGARGIIYLSSTVTEMKLAALKSFEFEVRQHGNDCVQAEAQARQTAEEEGMMYISPYNDIDIICGQATIGLEIFEALPEVDIVFVPVGGGGLISGIAAYLKEAKPSIHIVGCQPAASCVMYKSVQAGHILDIPSEDTLSDGTAGGVEQGSITFDFCCRDVDDWVLVSEEEISDAIYLILENHHKVIEGAAGVAVAAYKKTAKQFANKNVVIIICGANIGMKQLKKVIAAH